MRCFETYTLSRTQGPSGLRKFLQKGVTFPEGHTFALTRKSFESITPGKSFYFPVLHSMHPDVITLADRKS